MTKKKEEGIIPIETEKYSDELDVRQEISKVKTTRLQKEISSDVILAKFDKDKDRQYIIDIVYAGKYCVDVMIEALHNYKIYLQNTKQKSLTTEEEKAITQIIDNTIGLFVDRVGIFSIVNRNKDNNTLVKHILNALEEEKQQKIDEEGITTKITKGLKTKLRNQEEEQQ